MAGMEQATVELSTRLKELDAIGNQRAADRRYPIYDPIDHLGTAEKASRPQRKAPVDSADRTMIDRPDLPEHRALTYGRIERLPLFAGRPVRDQVRQGSLNDGWLLAAFSAVAGHRVHALRDVVRERTDGGYDVRLHDAAWDSRTGDWVPTGRRIELEVTPELPVDPADPAGAAFADTRHAQASWTAVLQKAFAGLDQTYAKGHVGRAESGYDRLDEGGSPSDTAQALALLTGERAGVICLPTHSSNAADLENAIRDQLRGDNPVILTTTRTLGLPHGLVGGQTYEVTHTDDGLLHLRNPAGTLHPEPLTPRQLIPHTTGHITTLR